MQSNKQAMNSRFAGTDLLQYTWHSSTATDSYFGIVLPGAAAVEILEIGMSGNSTSATTGSNLYYVTSGAVNASGATKTLISAGPSITTSQLSGIVYPNTTIQGYDLANVVSSGFTGRGVALQLMLDIQSSGWSGILWTRYRPIEFPTTY